MPAMVYPGGKEGGGLAKWQINEIPPHRVYLSPFLGYDAVLRLKRPAELSIGCELDAATIALWRDSPAGVAEWPGLEIWQCDGVAFLEYYFGLLCVARARAAADLPTVDRPAGDRDSADVGENAGWLHETSGLPWRPDVFVYCDPPYLRSTRRSSETIYRFELDEAGHVGLLSVLQRVPAPVMLCGYDSALYRDTLKGWRVERKRARTRRGPAVEVIWMNYARPAVLHDPRFLGRDRRKRDDWRRRLKSLRRKLGELSPAERVAAVEAVRDLLPVPGAVGESAGKISAAAWATCPLV